MTNHDEVRRILHETGFEFKDGRSAMEMTDEEVERFLTVFITTMANWGREMSKAFQKLTVSIIHTATAMQNMNHVFEKAKREEQLQQ